MQAALAAMQPPSDTNPAGSDAMGGGQQGAGGVARLFSADTAAEAMATSALADVMLQLSPAEVGGWEGVV